MCIRDRLLLNGELKALHVQEPLSGDTKEDVTFDHVPVKYGSAIPWPQIIAQFGELKDGISQVKLLTKFKNEDTGSDFTEVIGTVAYNATDETILDFTVDADTIPANTQTAINAVINPLKNTPGDGLPAAASGQRYLILEDIGSTINTAGGPAGWPDATATDLQASKFDIIQYDGTNWSVSFDASSENVGKGIHYVTNTMTGIQYKWTGNEDTAEWVKSYEGEYLTGLWSISLLP